MSISRESYFMRLITDIHESISHKHMSNSQYISLFLSFFHKRKFHTSQNPHISAKTHRNKAQTCLNPKT